MTEEVVILLDQSPVIGGVVHVGMNQNIRISNLDRILVVVVWVASPVNKPSVMMSLVEGVGSGLGSGLSLQLIKTGTSRVKRNKRNFILVIINDEYCQSSGKYNYYLFHLNVSFAFVLTN